MYQNPKAAPGHEISKSFSSKREAAAWLEREHRLVEAYWRGDTDWSTQAERRRLTFAEYANKFVDEYRTKDGRVLEEASARKKREALVHLLDSDFVEKPFGGSHERRHNAIDELTRQYRTACVETGVSVMQGRHAPGCGRRHDRSQPVTMAPPKLPPSQQAQFPPATPEDFTKLVAAMPEQSRITVYLATACGLRINEVCALQRKDINSENMTLTVRHGIAKGIGNKGFLRLKAPKTMSSYRTVDIPEVFIPTIKCTLQHDRQNQRPR